MSFFRGFRAIVLGLSSAAASGCVSMLFGGPPVKSAAYDFPALPSPWRRVDAGTADVAYRHAGDQASISVNSVCGQYQDQELEDLTQSLRLGLDKPRVVGVERLKEDGFPALMTTMDGFVAAAPVTIATIVVRTDRCVYDFIYAARAAHFAAHRQAFVDAAARFQEARSP